MPTGKPQSGIPAEILLSDLQNRLQAGGSEYYERMVLLLKNAEGVRRFAEWSAEYAPEYEKVSIHALNLRRDGKILDRLDTATFRTMQREQGFEQKIYDGRVTVATVIEDIRVGDVMEYAYTRKSDNPALHGFLGTRLYLGHAYPIRSQSLVVHAPRDRSFRANFLLPDGVQNLPSEIFSPSGLRLGLEKDETPSDVVYRWSGVDIPAVPFDGMIALRAFPYYPMLSVSSFTTWSDVAEWASKLFDDSGSLPEEAASWVGRCKRENEGELDRVAAAVSWVQRDVRYFAMAMGVQSLRPRKLNEIYSTRFGDCKDKTVFLVGLLRALGVEAWPALVSTTFRDRLIDHGPSPVAFNHAIVVYRIGGRDRWVDPTLEQQGGPPGQWAVPPYKLGLVLRPGSDALEKIPENAGAGEPDSVTEDTITVGSNGEGLLEARHEIRGLQADFYRGSLASSGQDEVSLRWLNYLGRYYSQLEEVSPVKIEDNVEKNVITITGHYLIPKFLVRKSDQSHVSVYAYALRALIDAPESRKRRWPYAIAGDRYVRHKISVELPFEVPAQQGPSVVQTDEFTYRLELGLMKRRMVAQHDLRIGRDYVPAENMRVFADSVDEILSSLSTSVHSSKPESTVPEKGEE